MYGMKQGSPSITIHRVYNVPPVLPKGLDGGIGPLMADIPLVSIMQVEKMVQAREEPAVRAGKGIDISVGL